MQDSFSFASSEAQGKRRYDGAPVTFPKIDRGRAWVVYVIDLVFLTRLEEGGKSGLRQEGIQDGRRRAVGRAVVCVMEPLGFGEIG